MKVHPGDSGQDSSHHFKGDVPSFTNCNSCPETDSVKDPLFNVHHLKLVKSFQDSLSIRGKDVSSLPENISGVLSPQQRADSHGDERWYIRCSAHGEEELFISKCTAVWSKSDGRGVSSIIKSFTSPTTIKHAMWASFPVEELTNNSSVNDGKKSNKCPSHSADRLSSIIICDGLYLDIYTDRGDHIPVSLQFTVSKVISFSGGIFLERSLQPNEAEIVASGGKLLRPLFYVLTYPLNEITPVMMKPFKNIMNSIASYSNESKYTLVGAIVEFNLVILYSRTERTLSVWRERKASANEVKSAVTAWGIDLSTAAASAAATLTDSAMKSAAYGSFNASTDSPFGTSFQGMHSVLSSTMKNKSARKSSISSPSIAQFKAMSPMSTVLSSKLVPFSSPNAKESPNLSVFSPSLGTAGNTVNGNKLRPNLLSYVTPRSSPRVFDYSRVDCIEKAILPEVCLDSLWQESSITATSGRTKHVYTTRDVLGQVYLAFQCESKLKLLKLEQNNSSGISFAHSSLSLLDLTDSQPLASLSMFLALDPSNNLVLYSGLHKVSLVYLPLPVKPLIEYPETEDVPPHTTDVKDDESFHTCKLPSSSAVDMSCVIDDSLNTSMKDSCISGRLTLGASFFSPPYTSSSACLPKTSSRPTSACKNTRRSFTFQNASTLLSPVVNSDLNDSVTCTTSSSLASITNISTIHSSSNAAERPSTARVSEIAVVCSLRDGAGDKVTICDSNGSMFRVSFPPIASSTVVSMCLSSLSSVLPKDLSLHLMSKWYCMRNPISLNEMTDDKELSLFKRCLLTQIGYEIEDLSTPLLPPKSQSGPSSNFPGKKDASTTTSGRKSDPVFADSISFKHSASLSSNNSNQVKKVKLDINSPEEASDEDWNTLVMREPFLLQENNVRGVMEKDYHQPAPSIVDTSNILNPMCGSLLYPYSPYILYAIHLTYEELKLHHLMVSFNESLVEILYLLACDLQKTSYQDHYFRDHPSICCKLPCTSRILESDFKSILSPSFFTESPPCIFSFLQKLARKIGLLVASQDSSKQTPPAQESKTKSPAAETVETCFAPYPIISQCCTRSRLAILLFASLGYAKSTINNNTAMPRSTVRSSNAASQAVNNGQQCLAFHEHDLLQPIQLHSLKHPANCNCSSSCVKSDFSMPNHLPLAERVSYAMDNLSFSSSQLSSFPPAIAFILMQSDLLLKRSRDTSTPPTSTAVASTNSQSTGAVTSAPIPDHKLRNLLSKISTSSNDIGDLRGDALASSAGSSVSAALAAAAAAAGSNSGVIQSNTSSNLTTINMVDDEDGFSFLPSDLLKQLFPEDQRVVEAHNLLKSSKPVKICIPHRPGLTDHELMEEQERHLYTLCIRTLALPIGRGMFTLRTYKPVIAETFPIPKLCLTGRVPPRNTTVELTHIDTPANMNTWPLFHNGVAAGLRACPSASKVIDSSWIMYNRPKSSASGSNSSNDATNEHAGFLLALGLNGHLDKLSSMNFYDYLGKGNELTRVAVLLGLAAARRGSMDNAATKMLSIHVEALLPPSSTELDIQPVVQVASVLGIGLLYAQSGNSHMAEVLLSEIGRPPGPEMEHYIDRESYALAAGLAFGLITLGKGNQLMGGVSTAASTASTCVVNSSANFVSSTCTSNLPPESGTSMADQLFNFMIGGHKKPLTTPQREKYKTPSYQIREGDYVNADVTSPGATLGLGMLFFNTGNETVASWVTAPDTQTLLEFVRPDFLLLRTLAKGLIMWSSIVPSKEWIDSHLPSVVANYAFRKLDDPNPRIDYETVSQAYCNIVSGAALVLGLKFAGTGNESAFKVILKFTKMFLSLQNRPQVTEQAGRSTIECSLNILIIALSLVMAGTGNLEVMKICRYMRSRTSQVNVVLYGSHMATHMALGFLFLGGCKYTLSRSPFAIACLIIALFPKFPIHSNDNRYHLQAFRHLYVLAVEPKIHLETNLLGLTSNSSTQFLFHKLKSLWQSLPPSSLPGEKMNTIKVDEKFVSMWSKDTLPTLFTSYLLSNDQANDVESAQLQQILSSYILFCVNNDDMNILGPLMQLEKVISSDEAVSPITSFQIWQLKLVIAAKNLCPLLAERFESYFRSQLCRVNKKRLSDYLKGVMVIDEASLHDVRGVALALLVLNLPPYGSLTPLVNVTPAPVDCSVPYPSSTSSSSTSCVADGFTGLASSSSSSVKSWEFVEFIMNLRHFALPMSTLIYLFEILNQQ